MARPSTCPAVPPWQHPTPRRSAGQAAGGRLRTFSAQAIAGDIAYRPPFPLATGLFARHGGSDAAILRVLVAFLKAIVAGRAA